MHMTLRLYECRSRKLGNCHHDQGTSSEGRVFSPSSLASMPASSLMRVLLESRFPDFDVPWTPNLHSNASTKIGRTSVTSCNSWKATTFFQSTAECSKDTSTIGALSLHLRRRPLADYRLRHTTTTICPPFKRGASRASFGQPIDRIRTCSAPSWRLQRQRTAVLSVPCAMPAVTREPDMHPLVPSPGCGKTETPRRR